MAKNESLKPLVEADDDEIGGRLRKKPACDWWRPEEASLWLVEAWRSRPVIGGLGGDGEVAKDVWNELLLVPLLTRAIRSSCRTPWWNNRLITLIFKVTGLRECAGCIFIHRMWMLSGSPISLTANLCIWSFFTFVNCHVCLSTI